MVNTEAMAYKCVPIIFNGGGHKEIIRDGKDGFLINNEKELIKRTLKLIEDKKLMKKMANKAFEKAKYFSYFKFKRRLLNFLKIK
jgi:glycosyltransferase involved in cell wall biosynthesis